MNRRTFLISSSTLPLIGSAGCVSRISSVEGNYADVWVINSTESEQTATVTMTDEADDTVLSESYVLTPEQTDGSTVRETEIARVNQTYNLEVSADGLEETYEWDVPGQPGVMNISIKSDKILFRFEPAEG